MVSPDATPEFGQMASAQFEADFEMRDGIRRDEQFKAEDSRQQMFVNVSGPKSGLMFFLKAFADMLNHFKEKRSRASGRIKNEHAMRFLLDFCFTFLAREGEFGFVGEAVFQSKFFAQQPVNAFDDVGNDGFGRVINAAQFAQSG